MKVLIVEDDSSQHVILNRYFIDGSRTFWNDDTQIELVHVNTLKDGLDKSKDCDICILDLILPDSQPKETVAKIKDFKIPVIIYTSLYDMQLVKACAWAGAANFVHKDESLNMICKVYFSLESYKACHFKN